MLQGETLEEYSAIMKNIHGKSRWKIGWESLPKYIGHKIYNTKTKQVATVNWDNGYPHLLDKENNEVSFHASEFMHEEGCWIYSIGEVYGIQFHPELGRRENSDLLSYIPKETLDKLSETAIEIIIKFIPKKFLGDITLKSSYLKENV